MHEHTSAFDTTPWQRMQSYTRYRLFGTETPVLFDWIALIALIIAIDSFAGMSWWQEALLVGGTWLACTMATSWYRAKAELERERLVEWQSGTSPTMGNRH